MCINYLHKVQPSEKKLHLSLGHAKKTALTETQILLYCCLSAIYYWACILSHV